MFCNICNNSQGVNLWRGDNDMMNLLCSMHFKNTLRYKAVIVQIFHSGEVIDRQTRQNCHSCKHTINMTSENSQMTNHQIRHTFGSAKCHCFFVRQTFLVHKREMRYLSKPMNITVTHSVCDLLWM